MVSVRIAWCQRSKEWRLECHVTACTYDAPASQSVDTALCSPVTGSTTQAQKACAASVPYLAFVAVQIIGSAEPEILSRVQAFKDELKEKVKKSNDEMKSM